VVLLMWIGCRKIIPVLAVVVSPANRNQPRT